MTCRASFETIGEDSSCALSRLCIEPSDEQHMEAFEQTVEVGEGVRCAISFPIPSLADRILSFVRCSPLLDCCDVRSQCEVRHEYYGRLDGGVGQANESLSAVHSRQHVAE